MAMIVREFLLAEKETYNKLVSHPLQSWEWGEFREKLGQKVYRIGHFDGKKMVQAYQVFIHCLPKTSWTVGYFPKGPKPNKEMIKALTKVGQENKTIFIKLEPDITKYRVCGIEYRAKDKKNTTYHIPHTTYPLVPGKPLFTKYTSIIDLTKSEEELLAAMHKKTRYNVRVAQKHEVEVEEDNSPESFENFLNLLFETTKRQGFYAHDKAFHRLQRETLQPAGISRLLTARYHGETLATFVLFAFNKTLYYPYGASTREHREVMAPTLLMWEAIKFGKKIGCEKFDLWGETTPNAKPSDPWYGWHRFKQGFGPEIVEFVGTFDLVLDSNAYRFFKIADHWRWKLLKLKTKFR